MLCDILGEADKTYLCGFIRFFDIYFDWEKFAIKKANHTNEI